MTRSAKGSKQWTRQWHRDPWVRRAQEDEYRSRAVYKLEEIDRKDRLFRPGQTVVDLGAAPGGWSQYACARVGSDGRVLAVDRLSAEEIDGVTWLQGDFSEPAVQEQCLAWLGSRRADLVLSDLAPNISGIRSADQERSMELARSAAEFAAKTLNPGGVFLVKVFAGNGLKEYNQRLRLGFSQVLVRKPQASRRKSREHYLLARDYKGT